MSRLTVKCTIGIAALSLWTGVLHSQLPPVDYTTQIQPIFDASCGGFCHVEAASSAVGLATYRQTLESIGLQYGGPVVVPFRCEESPLWEKIASDAPLFGLRMPRGFEPLTDEQIELVGRWIDEGAREFGETFLRGDVDHSGDIDITDAIRLLGYLFLGDPPPPCRPAADSDADGKLNLTDAINILSFLFLGGPGFADLSTEEQITCNGRNRPPAAEPIGTVLGREGVVLEFSIVATDPDGDAVRFIPERVPAGLVVGRATGVVRWTPSFGQAGDHRIRVRVVDGRDPQLATVTTGLVRIAEGNHPPVIQLEGPIYAREEVPLEFVCATEDVDGDGLSFALAASPPGSSIDSGTGLFRWTPARGQAGEHTVRFRVRDDGEPRQTSEKDVTLVVVSADSPVNQPPFVPPRGIYRSYPGLEILIPVGATDPDGDGLRYRAQRLPPGSEFSEETGVFRWTPAPGQLGPFFVPFTVTDDGLPPEVAEGLLVFGISPPDPCVVATCDPGGGCETEILSLQEDCCAAGERPRVAEPVAGCPEGRVLFVGRNRLGFGRLQSCDLLEIIAFPQGGLNVRFHVEARCIDTSSPVTIHGNLKTADVLIFDGQRSVQMEERIDGFAQRLGLTFAARPPVGPAVLDGQEALLSVTLTDVQGTVVRERVRVRLTLDAPEDLPNPDVDDVPAGEVGCVGCHRPLGPGGERDGIEDAHPWFALSCIDCHGGDAEQSTRLAAHVLPEGGPSFLRNLAVDRLDTVSPAYLQFVNPGDLRVASRGCGSQNPANPGSGCHQDHVESVRLSVMSTYAGHYTLPRYLAGSQSREATHAAIDVSDPDFDAATAPPGAVASLSALRDPEPLAVRSEMGTCIDIYLPKSCPTCHLSDFGPNDAAGNFRSSGCTACHMIYAEDGRSRSRDPVITKDFPPHPRVHALTTAVPTEQCTRCHFQGGRIGLAFRGIREGGFAPDRTPANGVTLGRELHAHDADYYFTDEDDTNTFDETPPDLHHEAGMVCGDCHVGGDVHGDGHLYTSERYQVGVRCEDCHGSVRQEIVEDPGDGFFRNSRGFPLRRIRRAEDGRILLGLLTEEREIEIPQIHRKLASGENLAMNEAMGVNENGFSHTDRLECYACHTSWRQTCFGCHITVDDRGTGKNVTTGERTLGAISVVRDDYSLDFLALGRNERGKITPLCSSMSIFLTYIDEHGIRHFQDRVRTSGDGRVGFGWNPFHHHTVSRVPQNCDRCHPDAGGRDNSALLRQTYGFGTGRFVVEDGDGVPWDLSAFLDEAGELIGDFPHPGTGPVPEDVRERALSIPVVPHPRQPR